MGARLMLIRGRVQKSDDVLHVVANLVKDKATWLGLPTEDGDMLCNISARADKFVKPGPDVPPPTAPSALRKDHHQVARFSLVQTANIATC